MPLLAFSLATRPRKPSHHHSRMEAPSGSVTASAGGASDATAPLAPLFALQAPPASTVQSDLAELDASMRELSASTSELTSAMGISQASLSSLRLRSTARVAMAAFPHIFHKNKLSPADGFLALRVGRVVDHNLLLSIPEGINAVLRTCAHATWP